MKYLNLLAALIGYLGVLFIAGMILGDVFGLLFRVIKDTRIDWLNSRDDGWKLYHAYRIPRIFWIELKWSLHAYWHGYQQESTRKPKQ